MIERNANLTDRLRDPRLGVVTGEKRTRAMGQGVIAPDQEVIVAEALARGIPNTVPPTGEISIVKTTVGMDLPANGEAMSVEDIAVRHPGGRAMGQ